MKRGKRAYSSRSYQSSEPSLDDYDESDSEFEDVDCDNVDDNEAELSVEKVIEKIAEGSDEEQDVGGQIIADIYGVGVGTSDSDDELLASDDESSAESSSEEDLHFVKGSGRTVEHVRQLARGSPSEYPAASQPLVERKSTVRTRPLTSNRSPASSNLVERAKPPTTTTTVRGAPQRVESTDDSSRTSTVASKSLVRAKTLTKPNESTNLEPSNRVDVGSNDSSAAVKIPTRVSIRRPQVVVSQRYKPIPPSLPVRETSSLVSSPTNDTRVDSSPISAPTSSMKLPTSTEIKLSIDKLEASRSRVGGYKKDELIKLAKQYGVAYKNSDTKPVLVDKLLAAIG